ncbi:MAG: division/cell wall cluster transcriptional repressor MraZ [Treponema sp.]|nr:division/cell wall cluster transcriptional repressor MraZ [Treponema sp.]
MELKTGSADSTLDDKGRVSIPIRFRDQFQGDLIISWGMEQCVWIMKPATWEAFEQRMRSSDAFNQEEWRYFEYTVLAQKQPAELDRAGRLAIPSSFRRYANMTRECLVICSEDRLSIWDVDTFFEYRRSKDSMGQAAMNKLGTPDIFRAG